MKSRAPGPRIDKPWGYELVWALTDQYAAKCLVINAHQRLSLQYHRAKTETVFVMAGILGLAVYEEGHEGTARTLKAGAVYHIPSLLRHRMWAVGDSACMVMEVSTPELDDVVRLEDDYGRVGG